MRKMLRRLIPSPKIMNILILALCLWQCYSFYWTGYSQGCKDTALKLMQRSSTPAAVVTLAHAGTGGTTAD